MKAARPVLTELIGIRWKSQHRAPRSHQPTAPHFLWEGSAVWGERRSSEWIQPARRAVSKKRAPLLSESLTTRRLLSPTAIPPRAPFCAHPGLLKRPPAGGGQLSDPSSWGTAGTTAHAPLRSAPAHSEGANGPKRWRVVAFLFPPSRRFSHCWDIHGSQRPQPRQTPLQWITKKWPLKPKAPQDVGWRVTKLPPGSESPHVRPRWETLHPSTHPQAGAAPAAPRAEQLQHRPGRAPGKSSPTPSQSRASFRAR